jgi:hypothetical protein
VREADRLFPSTAEVKKGGAISPLPHTSSLINDQLIKHGDKFIFILIRELPIESMKGGCDMFRL